MPAANRQTLLLVFKTRASRALPALQPLLPPRSQDKATRAHPKGGDTAGIDLKMRSA